MVDGAEEFGDGVTEEGAAGEGFAKFTDGHHAAKNDDERAETDTTQPAGDHAPPALGFCCGITVGGPLTDAGAEMADEKKGANHNADHRHRATGNAGGERGFFEEAFGPPKETAAGHDGEGDADEFGKFNRERAFASAPDAEGDVSEDGKVNQVEPHGASDFDFSDADDKVRTVGIPGAVNGGDFLGEILGEGE